jgi:glycogen synthase
MRIAVIICAYTEQRWDDLIAAVESVERQSLSADEIVIVIDHNPALFQRAQARFSRHTVIENPSAKGLSNARNAGIAATNADLLAFLDDDAVGDRDWLLHLVHALENPDVVGVGGRVLPHWADRQPAWLPEEFLWVVGCSHRGLPTQTAEIRNPIGASMLIRRSVFETVGGFNSEIGRVGKRPVGCEETELCIRARQQMSGAKFIYEPAALVQHRVPPERATWRYFWSRCYAEGLSKAVVSRLVGSKDGLSAERTHVFKTLPRSILREIITGNLLRAFAIIFGLLITASGYLRGLLAGQKPVATLENLSQPKRILMVSARYYPYSGGTETHVHEVAKRLADTGYDITILTTDPSGELPGEEIQNGVRVKRVKAYPANRDYYFAPAIIREIISGGWDIVHLQGYHTLVAPLTMLAALWAKIPYVVTFHSGGHSSTTRNKLRAFQYWLLKPLLRRASQLIGVSQFEADFFAEQLDMPRERFEVIPNGAHLPALDRVVEPAPYPLIVSSGRLERYKGHQHVIAALAEILKTRPDVRLRIAGTGPYEAELHHLAQELQVADQVEIKAVPATNRQGMAELLSQASLVVLFSEYEAHPVAVMEALSLKRPVLVADTSGLGELARRGLVSAVPLDSKPEQLAAAILYQLDCPHIPTEITLPTWDGCTASIGQVYERLGIPSI